MDTKFIPSSSSVEETPSIKARFSTLPPELHLAISQHLIYPDALSLKHTNRHFYSVVDTSINLKVEWLLERRRMHLDCPSHGRCDLGSDLRFCRGSVSLLMKRRREHGECESRPGLGCIIFGTKTCVHRKKTWCLRQLLDTKFTIEVRWILPVFAMVACFLSWLLGKQV